MIVQVLFRVVSLLLLIWNGNVIIEIDGTRINFAGTTSAVYGYELYRLTKAYKDGEKAEMKLKETLEKPEVVVKADEKVKSAEIMKVMNAAQDAEYKKLIVAGEPLSKKEQKELKESNQGV